MNSYNVYEKLYLNTKAKFTVVDGNNEYTLGEYMMIKAGKRQEKSNLPTPISSATTTVNAFFSYINEKLAVKNPPAKDKTIRKFPMRTSAASFLSAVLISALALSFGAFSINSKNSLPASESREVDSVETEDFHSEKLYYLS